MSQLSHDRLIAKLQRFADKMEQRKLEKEGLAIVLGKGELQSEIRSEILIYEEIIEDYYNTFEEILTR